MKCFVDPCRNHNHQGDFVGDVCLPCYRLAKDIRSHKLNRKYHFGEGCIQFICDNWREVLNKGEK